MKLIIVESPTKSNTIKRFLGRDYVVASSYGHIRDLPKGELGVDIEQGFKPKYVVPLRARKQVKLLKELSAKAELVILGVDEDREGEAIGWHLTQLLRLNGAKPYQRIVFHEITESAIKEALKNPRKININLVDAQQARRVLDRIVGYKLSPFLWKKVARGLSAGRVQSVAVRLVAEREEEVGKFVPQEYWSIESLLQKIQNPKPQTDFKALLVKKDGRAVPKLGIKNKKEADKILKELKGAEYRVVKVEKKEANRNPLPPFITSTLQQESWKRFRFSSKFTMSIAQNLYERGMITYHRSDSLSLSDLSLFAAKKFIIGNYGKEYWAGCLRKYKTKSKTAQEAHEAIRPTYAERVPQTAKSKEKLDDRQFRLYELIWRRFIASQMAQACFDSTVVEIKAGNPKSEIRNPKQTPNSKLQIPKYIFRAAGQMLKFDGFLKVYPLKFEETELPPLEDNEVLELIKLIPSQHFTQPPARYTEASLIKVLEENGIGRPSTYAPIISTIQDRNYIEKNEQKRFQPTEIGLVVNDLLVEHFPKIVDVKFTAGMEEDLDKVARGKAEWEGTVSAFYKPFAKTLDIKYKEIEKMIVKTKEKCEKCGKPMVVRFGKYGKFLACSGFPDCKNTKTLPGSEEKNGKAKIIEEKCEKCGSAMILRKGRYGEFLGCSRYPDCKNIKNVEKGTGLKCPECGEGEIVERRTRTGKKFWGCNRYPDCTHAVWEKPGK